MEELENLEETLNESIRESVGARTGKLSHGKTRGTLEDDEEDYLRYYYENSFFQFNEKILTTIPFHGILSVFQLSIRFL